jgi:hypothetical protein
VVRGPQDQAVFLELAPLLGQQPRRDPPHLTLQLVEPHRTFQKVEQHDSLPLAADDRGGVKS